jgi:fructose transport system permease protein
MERRTPLQRVQGVLHKYPYLSPLIVLLICIVVFYALNDRFLLPQNISFVTQQTVVVGTLAIAQTLVILTAGIDLSIGAATTLAQMMMANLAVFATASNVLPFAGQNPYLAIALGIGVGVLTGVINGFLIVRLNLPPFIVTLGTLSIFTALTLIIFKARTIQNKEMPDVMKWLGNTFQIGEFQLLYGVVIMIIMYVVFGYIL